nr:ectonucleotide pyrophosphatase/phosphodiesterase family member 6-like [Penaeus vannamei]
MAWTGREGAGSWTWFPAWRSRRWRRSSSMVATSTSQPRAGYAMEGVVASTVEAYCSSQPRCLWVLHFREFHAVMESLRRCPTVGENVNVFLKKDVPEPLHYKAHRLILEIVVIAKEGYMIRPPQTAYSVPESAGSYEGNHGLDNTNGRNPDMRAVLYAVGPYFAPGVRAGVVEQVDVYNLLCRSVQLQCHANNGTLAHVEAFFRPGVPLQSSAMSRGGIPLAALMAIVSALLLL